ncbi:MAG: response regulator [Deltaproteobacteria bacterium]|nr:response regulator [Deltaproteobacteria bacterium]
MHPSAPRKKVLVVDDEPDERILLSRLLELGGHKSILASDATEGLEKAVRERPDLIVLAVMFDHHGNLQMFDDLKLDATLKHIPVVLLSSIDKKTLCQLRALPGASRGGFLLEPEGFLDKPPEADELLGLLRTLTQPRPPEPTAGP